MQIRKLYQPANFSRASIRPTFRHFFGRSPLCSGVCAIGMEPNPEHARRLNSLETNMRRAGAGVLYLPVAASDSTHANLTFRRAGSDHHAADCDRDAVSFSAAARERVPRSSGKDKRQEADGAGGGGVRVQSIDLSRLIELIGARLRGGGARAVNGRAPSLVMKLDTEGHEAAVVPHLIRERVALCAVDFMSIEWHERLPALDAGMRRGARAARAQLSAALSRGGSTSISCPTGRAPARFPRWTMRRIASRSTRTTWRGPTGRSCVVQNYSTFDLSHRTVSTSAPRSTHHAAWPSGTTLAAAMCYSRG